MRVSSWVGAEEAKREIVDSVARYKAAARGRLTRASPGRRTRSTGRALRRAGALAPRAVRARRDDKPRAGEAVLQEIAVAIESAQA